MGRSHLQRDLPGSHGDPRGGRDCANLRCYRRCLASACVRKGHARVCTAADWHSLCSSGCAFQCIGRVNGATLVAIKPGSARRTPVSCIWIVAMVCYEKSSAQMEVAAACLAASVLSQPPRIARIGV